MSISWDFAVRHGSRATDFLKMKRGEVSRAKWARLLSQNQIREIVNDPDSDDGKYYASADT